MTREEFRRWLKRHGALFPEAHQYLTDPQQGTERCEAWFAVLGELPLELAGEASEELLAGREPQPRGASGHAGAIAQHSIRLLGRGRQRDPELAANLARAVAFHRLRGEGKSWSEICDLLDGPYEESTGRAALCQSDI